MIRKRLTAERIRYDESLDLVGLLTAIRRGRLLPANKKLLIVIDQFEQWLYAHTESTGTKLLDALLQSDGSRLQAVVMVRDDFWMAATRFFRDLDIPLLERHNSAAVDLFDLEHAERVLKAFGRAFGKLQRNDSEDKADLTQFVTESVRGLAQENKVISVRLALFAEMMKSRPWTLEALRDVGGTLGVGATFLEETFSAEGASLSSNLCPSRVAILAFRWRNGHQGTQQFHRTTTCSLRIRKPTKRFRGPHAYS